MEFWKLQASGNDFILIENEKSRIKNERLKKIAKKYCQRKFAVGADGLLVIEPSRVRGADFKMRIFNSDGSEPAMCGNGARCVAFWKKLKIKNKKIKTIKFETKAGLIEAVVAAPVQGRANVKIKVSDVFGMKLDKEIEIFARKIKVNFINSGVPHAIVFVQGLDDIDIEKIGRQIRYHKEFLPAGTNVNFVQVIKDNLIKIRTYERGVEAETLACGTGAVASSIISKYKLLGKEIFGDKKPQKYKMDVSTKSGQVLGVYFGSKDNKISDVWLEGRAYLVYQGKIAM
ncbi:MAG: diaminopimelate epimerase [Candidatus Omnitrophota bacterium]|nr:MAG: diaminopimelate epimerase [Candidatus Omnitrophota bacterium]